MTLRLATPSLSSARGRADQLAALARFEGGLTAHDWRGCTPGAWEDIRAFNGNLGVLLRSGEVRIETRGRTDEIVVYVATGGPG